MNRDEKSIEQNSNSSFYEYRLNELTDAVKEVVSDIKDLNTKVDDKFEILTDKIQDKFETTLQTLLDQQREYFDKLIGIDTNKKRNKVELSKTKITVFGTICSVAGGIIVTLINKLW